MWLYGELTCMFCRWLWLGIGHGRSSLALGMALLMMRHEAVLSGSADNPGLRHQFDVSAAADGVVLRVQRVN